MFRKNKNSSLEEKLDHETDRAESYFFLKKDSHNWLKINS